MSDLKGAVRRAIKDDYGLDVSRFNIRQEVDDDGDDLLLVEILLKKSDRKVKRNLFYFLISRVVKVISDEGEKRHAIILPRLARGQKLTAR